MPLAYLSNIVAIFPTFSIYDFNYTNSSRRKPLTTIPPPSPTTQLPQSLFETRTDPLNHVLAPHHVSCHLIGGFQSYIYNFFHMKWYVLLNKSFTDMFQILVMQYRRHFIHLQSLQVFSSICGSSRYVRYWLFRAFPAPISAVGSGTNPWVSLHCEPWAMKYHRLLLVCMYMGLKTSFYVVRHLDSIASHFPTGFHLGFFRSWPS